MFGSTVYDRPLHRVGKNGFEHNNLAIFELKLHWVPQSLKMITKRFKLVEKLVSYIGWEQDFLRRLPLD